MEERESSAGLLLNRHGGGIDGTHLCYFFVPLPEPLGFPDRYIVECTIPAPMEWVLQHARDSEQASPKRLLDTSLCFHHGWVEAGFGHELAELFRVAAKATDSTKRSWRARMRRSRRMLPKAERTIVEIVVPVSMPMLDIETPETSIEDESSDLLSEAFDRGLAYLRDIQRSYYLVNRRPLRLVTRSNLPFAVPVALRSLTDHSRGPASGDLSMFLLNDNLGRDVRDGELGGEGLDRFSVAMLEQSQGGIAARYLELVREGGVALDLDGDTRAAALLYATASEVLLDESLAHMLWETSARPEDAAVLLDAKPWLAARVKSLYHPRIGGSWDLRAESPVGAWFTNVASLRNRVAHAGYEPSFNEAVIARDSVIDLQNFLADRLCDRVRSFPRTAMAMVGRVGLEARQVWTPSVEALVHSREEVPWRETFARWRAAMQRCRQYSPTYLEPSIENAVAVAVLHVDGHVEWVAHDPKAAMAARIERGDIVASERQLLSVDEHFRVLRDQRLETAVSTALVGAKVDPSSAPHWILEYRLVPLAGVMVNGKDLDRSNGE